MTRNNNLLGSIAPYATCIDAFSVVASATHEMHAVVNGESEALHIVRIHSNSPANAIKRAARLCDVDADACDVVHIRKNAYRVTFMSTIEADKAKAQENAAQMNADVQRVSENLEVSDGKKSINERLHEAPNPAASLDGYDVTGKIEPVFDAEPHWSEWSEVPPNKGDDGATTKKLRRSRIVSTTCTHAVLNGEPVDGYHVFTSDLQSVLLSGTVTKVTETQTVCYDADGKVISDVTKQSIRTTPQLPTDDMFIDARMKFDTVTGAGRADDESNKAFLNGINDAYRAITAAVEIYVEFMATRKDEKAKLPKADFERVNNGIKAGQYIYREIPRYAGMPRGFKFTMSDLRKICVKVGASVGVIITDKAKRKEAISKALNAESTHGDVVEALRTAHSVATLGIKITTQNVKKALYGHMALIANKAADKVAGSTEARTRLEKSKDAWKFNMADSLREEAEERRIREEADAEEQAKRVNKQVKKSRPEA